MKGTTAGWICNFTGRHVGAIGRFYPATVYVHAATKEEVEAKLREDWEHISNLQIREWK